MSDSSELDESKKQFPYPFTLETLPPHPARALTSAEREALPRLVGKKDHPGPGFLELTGDNEGKLMLFPERMNGDDPMTEVRYYPHKGQDIDTYLNRTNLPDPEADVAFRAFSGSEMGTVWSHALAVELFDFARRHTFDASPEEQLLAAGFEAEETPGVYRRPLDKAGDFAVFLKGKGAWLMFEPRNKTYWHNLLILNTHSVWHSGEGVSPVLWPDTVNNPTNAIVGMAVKMAELWHPGLIKEYKQNARQAKKAKSPRP